MLRRLRLLAAVVATLMVVGLAAPAAAAERGVAAEPATVTEMGADLAREAEALGLEEVSVPVGFGKIVVRYDGAKAENPDWTIGFGWNIYLYLNRGDFIWLAGLGATAATAVLCFFLISSTSLAGAVACSLAGYIVSAYIIGKTAPAYGYCREFKIRYWGTLAGVKDVRRSC